MIRGSNTRPELLLRRAIWSLGFRYRLSAKLPGRPDFVFPRMKVAVFVDGCFWHGCDKHLKWPRSNAHFWRKKILGNRARDVHVTRKIRSMGWAVIRVWEHEIRHSAEQCAVRIGKKLSRQNR